MVRIWTGVLILLIYSCTAQEKENNCAIAFYNVENLFDTKDDPKTADEEFTPKGAYRYTEKVYEQKLHNIATVIERLDAVIVGLAEVENSEVLDKLVAQPELQSGNYKYVWFNSPDPRGIDVALLYRQGSFKVLQSAPLAVKMKGMATRDVLYVQGVLSGDTVHLLVNHWPSRGEGMKESEPKRIAAAKLNRRVVDSLLLKDAHAQIIIMGDMNDNPDNTSIATVLGAGADKAGKLYNPCYQAYKTGRGTSVYHKQWDHFDQVIISAGLLKKQGWYYNRAQIYDADFIRNKGYEDAYPLRSFKGKNWNNGYSDHLPVLLHLKK